MEKINVRIAELMGEKGLTLRDLAEAVSCSKSAMQRYVSGERPIPTSVILGLSKAFEVHPAYLFCWTDDRNFDIEREKPTAGDDELSESQKVLMRFVETVPPEKAGLVLRVMKSILGDDEE